MTYFVQKEDFHKGDVADAEKLMDSFYQASSHLSQIDQNNIAPSSINRSVSISPRTLNLGDRHRGIFAAYNNSGLMYIPSGSVSAGQMINLNWVESDKPLAFTSRVSAHYTFFMQAYAYRAAGVMLNVDATILINGKKMNKHMVSASSNIGSGTDYVPLFMTATEFLEPNDWTVVPAFRSRVQSGALPAITGVCIGAIGMIR